MFAEHLTDYFVCEAGGVDPNNPGLCDGLRDAFREFSYPQLVAASFVLLDIFPLVFLLYTVNFAELKEKWMNFRNKKRKTVSLSRSEVQSTGTRMTS